LLALQALPATASSSTLAGPLSSSVSVTVTTYATAAQMAMALFAQKVDGASCGTQLLQAFPTLTLNDMAVAMAQGGYAAADTSKGLLAAWPQTTPAALSLALVLAYPPAQTPAQSAQTLFKQGVTGAACGTQLLKTFPSITLNDMAVAMAQGGYAAADTAKGLIAAWPQTPPAALSAALVLAYPKTQTPQAFAATLKSQGVPLPSIIAQCASKFNYTTLNVANVGAIAQAMQGAGFLAKDIYQNVEKYYGFDASNLTSIPYMEALIKILGPP
jgi:hypothetical protein